MTQTESCTTVGRLAPSPTGLLHLGNIWAFLSAWLFCRAQGGRLLLRMEDIDPARSREAYADACIEDLSWLGIGFDAAEDGTPWYTQSTRTELYLKVLDSLRAMRRTYPCFCTRKELKAMAGAPHCEDDAVVYSGTCRTLTEEEQRRRLQSGAAASIRLRCDGNAEMTFVDGLYGRQHYSAAAWGGDFPLMRSDGVFAYQLATAVDDATTGVTQVVRGRDLLVSAARQLYLLQVLGLRAPREYIHIPLLLDATGERLAKRHRSLTIRSLRVQGQAPERVTGFLGYLMGMNPEKRALSPEELLERFFPSEFPKNDIRISGYLLDEFF